MKKFDGCLPLLLTSSINVSAPKTRLLDPADRFFYTIRSIEEWLKINKSLKIVLCDGSGFKFGEELFNRFPSANIECLSFQNDVRNVELYGKGYGEGEIIKYALDNSRILRECDVFAKCTSKLWVKNYWKYIKGWNGVFLCDASFSFNEKGWGMEFELLDTRFYVADKKTYENRFLNAYKRVRDMKGYYLEHSFKDVVQGCDMKGIISNVPLDCRGVSGSMARIYDFSFFEYLKKRIKITLVKNNARYRDLFVSK